jgi:hypothetical protein
MKRNTRQLFQAVTLLAGAVALQFGASEAHAQYGMGMGMFMPMRMVPSPQEFINQHALVNAGRATMGPVNRPVYANNPNSYLSRVRDNGFTSHYGVNSRRSPGLDSGRRRSSSSNQGGNNSPQPETATAPRPLIAIGSFFNSERTLVWPNDAPVTGDLKGKRDTSDQACLVVADLVEKFRSAPITTVTDARQKLLEYGRPALSEIRSHSTPRIAEAFHHFMLSLYDSLAQAAEPQGATAAANTTTPRS